MTQDEALLALLLALKAREYRFVTITPASHARVLARGQEQQATGLRDVLGWSKPFSDGVLDRELLDLLRAAEALEPCAGGMWKCRYRVSSLGDDLYLHSAYPTSSEAAVFFGPDSYRFADLVKREFTRLRPSAGNHLVDIGAGAGVGAISAARVQPRLRVSLTDINPAALRLAQVNARAAGVTAEFLTGANLDAVHAPVDIALANPPYIIDSMGRDYRDGGDMHGGRVAFEMATAAVERLAPGGRLILYTGSAILAGMDPMREALGELAAQSGCDLLYDEIDPDVFGEELGNDAYNDVERIALVSAVITRRGSGI